MKIILISIFLCTLGFADKTQIVIGTYSNMHNALKIKRDVDKVIEQNRKMQYAFKKYALKTKAKPEGKYFIVTVEPIKNVIVESKILKRIKKTKFKDAFAMKLEKKSLKKEI